MGTTSSGCRSCEVCVGSSHHWLPDPRPHDPSGPEWKCKHCLARGSTCTFCAGEGCRWCRGEGVILVAGVFTAEDAENTEED